MKALFKILPALALLAGMGAHAGGNNGANQLAGEWIFTDSAIIGEKVEIRADHSLMHSVLGEGDIKRISGDRYKITIYHGNEDNRRELAPLICQVLIRKLGDDKKIALVNLSKDPLCKNGLVGGLERKASPDVGDEALAANTRKIEPEPPTMGVTMPETPKISDSPQIPQMPEIPQMPQFPIATKPSIPYSVEVVDPPPAVY